MIHDLKQLAADAKSVRADRAKFAPTNPPVYIGHAPAPDGPDTRLAAFVADLLDETPLTVEGLVAMGFEKGRFGRLELGEISAYKMLDDTEWTFNIGRYPANPQPRTLGELAMLLAMMEGRK